MKKFDVNAYLDFAERKFSGANGYEYGDFVSNDDLDLGFDGSMVAASVASQAKQPSPYQVSVVNSTAGALTAVLFGNNQYLLTSNFGSAVGITVTPSQTNVSYLELLQQSAAQPFETSLIRIQSTNTAQITNIVTITSKDANGQLAQIPLITQSYFSANQFQSGILDIPFSLKIDGNTNLSFSVLANTTVVMTFFPSNKANVSRQLNGNSTLQTYALPNVPVAATPVYVSPRVASAPRLG